MAFSRLQLHEVNVTAVRGSVNVCVCVCCRAQSCSKCPSVEFTIHLSPLTHVQPSSSPHSHTHMQKSTSEPPTLAAYLRSSPSLFLVAAPFRRHLHKNIPPFLELSP